MEPILAGLGFGAIGALGGAALAFWWRSKMEAAKGLAALLTYKLDVESKEHETSIKAALGSIAEMKEEDERKEELISALNKRVKEIEVRRVDTASDDELLNILNRRVLVAPKEDGNKGGVP